MKLKTKTSTILIITLLISVCFIGLYQISVLPLVHAQTITLVSQGASGYAQGSGIIASGTFTVTLQQAPVSGNLLILNFNGGASGANPTISGITQTNVAWSVAIAEDSGVAPDSEIWKGAVSASAGTVITVTVAGGTGTWYYELADVCEWSGLSGVVDKTAVNAGGTSSATSTGTTAATTQTVELWIGAISASFSSSQAQSAPTNSFTLLDGADKSLAGQHVSTGYLYYVASSTGTASSGTTLANSGTNSGCIATFYASGTSSSVTQYVNGYNSKVDSAVDVGSHSNFTAQQQAPVANNPYNDTLTEANTVANTTSSFGNTATTDTSYTTTASLTAIGMNYTTPANAYKLYNITARVKYSASTMNLECILVNYTTSAIVATTSNVSVTTTKGWFTASFASPPVVNASSIYLLMVVSAGTSLWAYYSSTTTGYQYAGSLSSWAATSVTSLTHTNATNYEIYANCSIGIPNYQLGLEENFTSIPSTYAHYQLDVSMCTQTYATAIGLQIWTGSAWTNLTASLTSNSWNNFTNVNSYVLSSTLTIKFLCQNQPNPTTQCQWAKDCAVLYIYGTPYMVQHQPCLIRYQLQLRELQR